MSIVETISRTVGCSHRYISSPYKMYMCDENALEV